ncbi:hypothetical protein [Pseudoalteromonas sp. G24-MNA-CIBAN-0072]|uniref:hypothetical protein n=1 Tax=Pseudoalteromonas sp. G24-MNA-CIBAN-0072 TaxID=3140418 RepID=UPI0033231FEC
MSKFSLDNYRKKTPETSRFSLPDGVKIGSVYENIFNEATKRIVEIEQILESSSGDEIANMSIKDIKIVVDQLIFSIGKQRNQVRMDRGGKLSNFIFNENERLQRLWESKKPKGEGKRKTRDELADEVDQLKKDLEAERQKNLHEFFNCVVSSEILDSHKSLSDRLIETRNLYKAEQEKNAVLHQKNNGLIRELNARARSKN